jgi:KaiC/GvpD/RAD55 family RecA-like ATPase
MTQRSTSQYEFHPDVPLAPVQPGTNLLVWGPSQQGARELALRMLLSGTGRGEGVLLVSADVDGRSLLERCEETAPVLDRSLLAILDCSGTGASDQERFEPYADPVDDPGDVAAIEVELAALYESLARSEPPGIRIGLFSASSLFAHGEHRAVSRFLHMLTGRVIAMDDLGVLLADTTSLDDPPESSVAGFCDGHVEVRAREDADGFELRVHGLDDQPTIWVPFTPGEG